jgi:glycosyltransferase involved in cell wall biosynthesis
LKVLAHLHMYPPHHNAGAELMLHTLLRDLVGKNHEVRVLVAKSPSGEYVHQGVTVSRARNKADLVKWFAWADVAVTHLDLTRQAMAFAGAQDVPLVHIVHNDRQLKHHGVTPQQAQLVVFNSKWIALKAEWEGRSIVIRPPVIAEDYRTAPGAMLTLINLSASKGAELFYELARRLPRKRFLGVKGSYAHQVVPEKVPENVTIVENTPNIREVYSQTRVLLMPSDYESWGRVAIEAAASGIPTIAHPTQGLLESLSDAGIFADRTEADDWVTTIRWLDDQWHYREKSKATRARSEELDPTAEFELFERSLRELI